MQVEVASHVKVQRQPRKTPEALHPIAKPTQKHHLSVAVAAANNFPLVLLVLLLLKENVPRHRVRGECGSVIDCTVAVGVVMVSETSYYNRS